MMKFLDWMVVVLWIYMMIGPGDLHSIAANIVGRLLLSVIPLLLGLIFCGWRRRWRSDKQRKELLKTPIQTVQGTLTSVHRYDTGKQRITHIPTGYTQEGVTGRVYYHYKYGWEPIYDGYAATVVPSGHPADAFEVRTLPQDFFCHEETIPEPPGEVTVSYVTDASGVHYYVYVSRFRLTDWQSGGS